MPDKTITMTCPKCKGKFVVYELSLPQGGTFRCPYCSQVLRRAVQPTAATPSAQAAAPAAAAQAKPSSQFIQDALKAYNQRLQKGDPAAQQQQPVVAQPAMQQPVAQPAVQQPVAQPAMQQPVAQPAPKQDPNPTMLCDLPGVPKPQPYPYPQQGKPAQPIRPIIVMGGREFSLNMGRNTIGRQAPSSKATLQLPTTDKYMSRVNAVINVTPTTGGPTVATIESVNPENLVKYYGRPLAMGVTSQLYPNTPFTLGRTQMTFKLV